MSYSNYQKGSEWHKWDLHVHPPQPPARAPNCRQLKQSAINTENIDTAITPTALAGGVQIRSRRPNHARTPTDVSTTADS